MHGDAIVQQGSGDLLCPVKCLHAENLSVQHMMAVIAGKACAALNGRRIAGFAEEPGRSSSRFCRDAARCSAGYRRIRDVVNRPWIRLSGCENIRNEGDFFRRNERIFSQGSSYSGKDRRTSAGDSAPSFPWRKMAGIVYFQAGATSEVPVADFRCGRGMSDRRRPADDKPVRLDSVWRTVHTLIELARKIDYDGISNWRSFCWVKH